MFEKDKHFEAKILRAVKDLSINLSVSPVFRFCAEVAHLYT